MPRPLILQLRFTRSEFARAVKGVTEEEAVVRPHGLNAIGRAVAHLTWQEQKYFLDYGQGTVPFPDVDRAYRPEAPASTPPLADALATWRDVTHRADAWLDALDVAAMAAPAPRITSTAPPSSILNPAPPPPAARGPRPP